MKYCNLGRKFGKNREKLKWYVVSKYSDSFSINLPCKIRPLGIPMLIEPCLKLGDRGLVSLPYNHLH